MNADEFKAALARVGGGNVKVATRSGKVYWLHEDQLDGVEHGGPIYGVPVKKSLRDNNSVRWFEAKNIRIVDE